MASSSTTAASLLSSYFNPPLNLSTFNPRSVNSKSVTVTSDVSSNSVTCLSSTPLGILGSVPPSLHPVFPPPIPPKPSRNPAPAPPPPSTSKLSPAPSPVPPSGSIPPTTTWASKVKSSIDRSLERLSPLSYGPSGNPRVVIPDEVYQMGAQLHKDFVVCKFFGRIPAYSLIQNVLNYMWGKGKHLEIHMSPATNSVLVRIPNEFIKQKVLLKGYWYVDTSMFFASQWSANADTSAPSLQRVQLWAHLIDVPLDLIHNKGLSHIAGQIGEPKETDDWTLRVSSISVAHVKVEVDATLPLPKIVEVGRQDGSFVNVSVEYPWVPPLCAICKEIGHISKSCPLIPPPPKPAHTGPKQNPPLHSCYSCKQQGHLMKNCPKKPQEWTLVKNKSKSTPQKTNQANPVSQTPKASLPPDPSLPTSSATTFDPSTSQLPPSPSPYPPATYPLPISMAVDNPSVSITPQEKSLHVSDSEMEDASCQLSPEFIVALPAPHISRPVVPIIPSSLPQRVVHVSSTSFNPFIPKPPNSENPTTAQNSLKPTLPELQPFQSSTPLFSATPLSNPFLPLSFDTPLSHPTSDPSSPPPAQGMDDTPL